MPETYDVIVIGGGPAGSATATLVAREGRRALLLERERFPRFHIGESLMPATYWPLRRLGVLEKMATLRAPRKHSVQFFLKDGSPTRPFYFSEVANDESAVTWQVDRAAFDGMLLDHAAGSGVEVRQGTAVQEVRFEGERAVGVRAAGPDGATREIDAPIVVDASGQTALLSRRLRLRRWDPVLKNAAFFTRYRGARRDPGIDAGAILVLSTRNKDSWFWFIPLPGELTSVGVVGPIRHLVGGRSSDPQTVYDEELRICPALQERLRSAVQVAPMRVLQDFSYVSRRIAGDGWLLVGDAFGFLDPIYSSGVLLALTGAEMAAEAILDALAAGDPSAARLGRHGERFVAGMEAFRRVVYAFYDKEFSFAGFLRRHPTKRDELTHLLFGDVFRRSPDGLIEALEESLVTPGYRPLRLAAGSSA
jgi:flavin-dependent dehydrogenase